MRILRWLILLGVIFGLGYYTGQQPDTVKQTLRDLSGEVLENTIGLDPGGQLHGKMLDAKEAFLEGRAYVLDNQYQEASEEFDRVRQHLDQAVELDPNGPLAQKIDTVKLKIQEAQQSLSEGRGLPPGLVDDLRRDFQSVLP